MRENEERESAREDGWRQVGQRRGFRKEPIATFFFTHFPENFDARSMWGVFQKWGKVVDLFIPNRRNKEGWRFGFVKMAGVQDPANMARRIDQLYIGSMKLYVNIPRFQKEGSWERRENADREFQRKNSYDRRIQALNFAPRKEMRQVKVEKKVTENREKGTSYKQALLNYQGAGGERNEKENYQDQSEVGKAEDLALEGIIEPWMERSIVGKLRSPELIQAAYDCFVMAGLHSVRVRYMGGLSVLLTGEDGLELMDVIKDSGEGWKEVFEDLSYWNSSLVVDCRIPWIRCEGLPLQFWNKENFEKVVKPAGILIEIDEETSSFSCLRFARLRVKTSSLESIFFNMRIKIGNQEVGVRLVEEIGVWEALKTRTCDQCVQPDEESSVWSKDGEEEMRSESEGEDGGGFDPPGGDGGGLGTPEQLATQLTPNVEYPTGCVNDGNNLIAHDEGTFLEVNGGTFEEKIQHHDISGAFIQEVCVDTKALELSHVSNFQHGGPRSKSKDFLKKQVGPTSVENNIEKGINGPVDFQLQFGELKANAISNSELNQVGPNASERNENSVKKLVSGDIESGAFNNNQVRMKNSIAPRQNAEGEDGSLKWHIPQSSLLTQPIARKEVRQNLFSLCSSLSDSAIANCNRGFWIRNEEDEARNIWDFGKLLGVSFSGEDKEIISRLVNMEKRDESAKREFDREMARGDHSGL